MIIWTPDDRAFLREAKIEAPEPPTPAEELIVTRIERDHARRLHARAAGAALFFMATTAILLFAAVSR